MSVSNKRSNLILSGGGVKGIAYIGALEEFERRGWNFLNIAGVSAGSIVGTILASGYSAHSLRGILNNFNFEKVKGSDIVRRIPMVSDYIHFFQDQRSLQEDMNPFLFMERLNKDYKHNLGEPNFFDMRSGIVKKIIKFCKQGYLFDGDYIEEWIYGILRKRGIRTFGDLRGGLSDRVNPNGYKMRMTAVDATRGKIVVLPDDMEFYGINPDNLEVAKAVRMSTSVPFVFKPVHVKRIENNIQIDHNFVDGGVFDNFPFWLIDSKTRYVNRWGHPFNIPSIGMKLEGKKSFHGLNPFNILKNIISSIYDIGVPENVSFNEKNIIKINTSNISFLDFDLSDDELDYLMKYGYKSAKKFLGKDRIGGIDYWYLNSILILMLLFLKSFFNKI
ncbi:patatin-like phospholipase family protein [Herbivorax sp. ANBcel31]|uniref:patatin-like phospholipase family protein n=1 Tax=Herbivorax sp. ANBcel31 TaxID=3069754 RepID=UPI0027B4F1E3|nr:patatin-like phospholipase family protein [Herbivorax sp. ANBcel31]MDQ2086849.1 patatin-like phospholipase family protein [Herbivorax sp. ANBcel31]